MEGVGAVGRQVASELRVDLSVVIIIDSDRGEIRSLSGRYWVMDWSVVGAWGGGLGSCGGEKRRSVIGSIVGSVLVDSGIGGSVVVVVSVGVVLGSIRSSARSRWIAHWSTSRLSIWGSGWNVVGVGVALLVACEPMVIVVTFVIAAAERMIARCSTRRLSIWGSGWDARGVWVELGLLVIGKPRVVVIVGALVAAVEQVLLHGNGSFNNEQKPSRMRF